MDPKVAYCIVSGLIRGHVRMAGATPARYDEAGRLERLGTARRRI